jgi:RHS repeat-associated protein
VDNGATSTSAYDSSNWRVKKVAGGVTTHYVWEGEQVIAEYNASTGALISEYIFVGSRMVARDQGGTLRYYHQDRLSTRMITDGSGAVMGTEDHLPFGEDAGTTGDTEKHRFTSYERDSESGTDYAVNRQHLINSGRFAQPDVLAGSILYPQSLNRYSYVRNDSINSADALGLVAESVWGLYWGTSMGVGGGGFGFGQGDYDFWGYRIADLPGFGTMWGSLGQLEEWRYNILVGTGWKYDAAFPKATDDFDYDNLVGPNVDYQGTECDRKVASLFGGEGAVAAASGFDPPRPDRGTNNPHLIDKAHLYGSADGRQNTSIYIAEGFKPLGLLNAQDSIYGFYYATLGSQKNVTLIVMHVANYVIGKAAGGRVSIGQTGGPGGTNNLTDAQTTAAGIGFYNHAHLEVFRGRGFPKVQDRSAKRIPFGDVFCR